jgi:hypothetical protein
VSPSAEADVSLNVIGEFELVILHLNDPTEKFWGLLLRLDGVGLWLRGLNLASFDDWLSEAARNEGQGVGLSTMFVPMRRVERLFLDEQVGAVESYSQRFERRVGVSVIAYLDLTEQELGDAPS